MDEIVKDRCRTCNKSLPGTTNFECIPCINAKFLVIHQTETYAAYLERYKAWAQKRMGIFGRDGSGLDNDGNAVLTPFGRARLRDFDVKHDEPRFAGFDAGRGPRDT